MKRIIRRAALIVLILAGCPMVWAQARRQPYSGRGTWYEFLLNQFNPRNVDYGAWLERRRQAFLETTVRDPFFWCSLLLAAALLTALLDDTKRWLDHRRSMRVTSEMMADIYAHDLYSRRAANQAIRKYNEHIEHCNREIEAAESDGGRSAWGDAATERMKAELQRVTAQLDATTQERNKLQDELRQKALIVADLSTRLDNLAKKINGPEDRGRSSPASPPDGSAEGARLVGQVNRLQEELYAERQKNRRLKGA